MTFVLLQKRTWLLPLALTTLWSSSTLALDVEVTDYACDDSLPITADFTVKCDGMKKCTFGTSTATVAGYCKFPFLWRAADANVYVDILSTHF